MNQPKVRILNAWLYESIEDIRDGLLGGYSESLIRRAIRNLLVYGYLSDRPSKNKFDRTREYLFNVPTIQTAINGWWKLKTLETPEKSETVNLQDRNSENNDRDVKFTGSTPQNYSVEIDENTTSLYINSLSYKSSSLIFNSPPPPTFKGRYLRKSPNEGMIAI